MSTAYDVKQSPCVGECGMNEEGFCVGCYRTTDEINSWALANDEERLEILKNVEQRKDS